ncbi:YhcH/YjgK/YiaL family protein [Paenibacillus eucommiae]|uniref:YhcH/YjgK/YiaL family protein n=1 Tax=Paenibacillus eucommiae TaxID=1355755 RepID=A0ABS4ITA8_9BACL|nr:YhcH/YjgK/YiaL family protein [Paenibacillus eucommiae]MBP1990116.1 YhcH/YjgK/YiaL family protein [Paenibacillus eucommiae]
MILDHIANAGLYTELGERLATALDFLKKDAYSREPGRYDIDGNSVYALVQHNDNPANSLEYWEAHQRYIDVHYIFEGAERLGYAHLSQMAVTQPYDQEEDYLLLKGNGSFFELQEGSFAIFYPEDVHMPGLSAVEGKPFKKVVVKVLIESA